MGLGAASMVALRVVLIDRWASGELTARPGCLSRETVKALRVFVNQPFRSFRAGRPAEGLRTLAVKEAGPASLSALCPRVHGCQSSPFPTVASGL